MGRKHAKAKRPKVERYPQGTPTWKVMRDYYLQVAKDAEAMGKKLKAKRYRKKAAKEFFKAGGTEIEI